MDNVTEILDGNTPLVSVLMITYGQEKYIEEAILSVLKQKISFKCELVIGNDCSPDGSHQIILGLIANNTNSNIDIKYIHNEQNIGMMPNFINIYNMAKGKYIAFCEGDDYWLNSLRLQKQVDFLESNLDFNITVGRYNFYYEATNKLKRNKELFNINKELKLKDYIAFNFAHTSTFLFRNNFKLPNWIEKVHAGDQSVFVLAADDKKIKYFNEVFSVYRVHRASVSHVVNPLKAKENTLFFLDKISEYTNRRFDLLIRHRKLLNKLYYSISISKNSIQKNLLLGFAIVLRWFGIHVLVKFVK
ncbi:glycosyltransferase [Lutibacter maritimus]|uniref:Glycosyltransferase involved in cell wall bisynthesis n=1 Tax=Lutibacter maritimus TaxID=593133 RepID=A0A1I6QMY0_9FLAO|nr:glycosyltransferase [Lutibacter maritimus]SFS53692.1 Glycosyltransferase involved in cell wall bisynthesis [Lutibacter maritimus]